LIDSDYSQGHALLRFLDEAGRLVSYSDKTGHVPYLLSTQDSNDPVIKSKEKVWKYDGIRQEKRELFKHNVSIPTDVYDRKKGSGLRNRISPCWEQDIKYRDCYVYDRNLTYMMPIIAKGEQPLLQHADLMATTLDRAKFLAQWQTFVSTPIPELPICAIDIEVFVDEGSEPNIEKAETPVIAFSLVSATESKVLLLSDLHDERALFEQIALAIKPYNILVTFFGDGLDIPYLKFRAKKLGVTSLWRDIYLERDKGYQVKQSIIRDKVHLDIFKFFNNSSIRTYAYKEAYGPYPSLGELAGVFLGEKKAGDRRRINEMTPQELSRYCLHDSEMTFALAKKAWPLMCMLARICRMPLREISRKPIGAMDRSLFYSEMRKVGYLIPNKEDMEIKNKSYNGFKDDHIQGAYIFPPVEGFHEEVFQLDVSSLYPSMIDKHNIGPDTVQCTGHPECENNIVPEHGFHVCTKVSSILSTIIGTLKDVRVDMKHSPEKYVNIPVKDVVGALKVLANSAFGVFGDADNETLYVRMVAEAVTAYGRDCITRCGEIAQAHGARVLYGDTDSLFLRNVERDVIESINKEIHDKLSVSMEIDNEYRYLVLHKKKNYLGVTHDGRLVIKGMLGKKKHVPQFIKQTFNDITIVMKDIESRDQFDGAKDKIEGVVKERICLLRARKIPLEELAFTVWLSKDIQHGKGQAYDAARFAVNRGVRFTDMDRNLHYVLTTGNVSAKPLGFVTQEEVNVEQYLKHFESYVGNQLLDRFGMNFKSIAYGGNLDRFIVEE